MALLTHVDVFYTLIQKEYKGNQFTSGKIGIHEYTVYK